MMETNNIRNIIDTIINITTTHPDIITTQLCLE